MYHIQSKSVLFSEPMASQYIIDKIFIFRETTNPGMCEPLYEMRILENLFLVKRLSGSIPREYNLVVAGRYMCA